MNFENCKGYMTCPELLNMIVEVYNTGVDPGHMDQKSSGQDTWFHICLLVHVPRANPRMGHLFNRIQQLKAWHVAIRILKIHPQTAEIWNQVPWPRGIWSTCPWSSTVWETYSTVFCSLKHDMYALEFWKSIHRQLRYEISYLGHVSIGTHAQGQL